MVSSGRNVELKARCAGPRAVEALALAAGAEPTAVLHQHDTYFAVRRGRLKLRAERREPWPGWVGESAAGAELIHYERADEAAARASAYERLRVGDPGAVRAALGARLGIVSEVRKVRRLLLWRGVRIHLDDVEGLGTFLELEAVVGPAGDGPTCVAKVAWLRRALGVADGDILAEGYAALLHARGGPDRTLGSPGG
ncbi:class IV adenylate cyclase [Patulibacter americanus]|uniref:class IV adenylate cyclase n=1 Tax=Patulibacter americanus TaxID=588672 RepID=UPI0003B597C9|nr:class IV adenylate cyclase [Patulibacter americanus]